MADKFLKVSRGFVNTVIYFRVPEAKVAEAEAEFATWEDDTDGHTSWVSGQGLGLDAVNWADRHMLGFGK